MKLTERDEVRFWTKVALPDAEGHMLWMAACGRDGYGRFGVKRRAVLAHRIAYELAHGPIPQGLQIDHVCCNRTCVAPEHLEAVTQQENIRRGQGGAHWAAKTHCPQGHPYDEVNTYRTPRGGRECRTCRRAAQVRHRVKRQAA